MPALPKIKATRIEAISRELVDCVTHRDVGALLEDCGIAPAGGTPRWERMLLALKERQERDGCANIVIAYFCAALHPARFRDNDAGHREIREKVNYQLAFDGIQIGEDGKARPIPKAETRSEAEERAQELLSELRRRLVHADVIRYAKPEYLQQNYFHCVLEAAKSLAQKIRDKTGLPMDGGPLVDAAFSVKSPLLAINKLSNESEESEHKGLANMLRGIFGTFRNPTAHAPKVSWAVNKQDALDALTIISYAHRRLDEAIVVPKPQL